MDFPTIHSWTQSSARKESLLPVSYTHLDVYKRQDVEYWMGDKNVFIVKIYEKDATHR